MANNTIREYFIGDQSYSPLEWWFLQQRFESDDQLTNIQLNLCMQNIRDQSLSPLRYHTTFFYCARLYMGEEGLNDSTILGEDHLNIVRISDIPAGVMPFVTEYIQLIRQENERLGIVMLFKEPR